MTQENTQPGYFLIIPAFVANCLHLDAETKLLYGRITSLSNQKGYCFASDEYLAELSGCEKRVIQDRLRDLEKMNFIKRDTKKKGVLWDRKIFPILHDVSNKVYEEHVHATRDAQSCDSNGTNVLNNSINNTSIRKKTTAEKENSAAKAASAVEFLQKRKKEKDQIHDCLKQVDIPQQEKVWITKNYPDEQIVTNALAWTLTQAPYAKSMAATLKYGCLHQTKPEVKTAPEKTQASEDEQYINKQTVKEYLAENWSNDVVRTSIRHLGDHVRVGNDDVYYKDLRFNQMFEHFTRKLTE